MPYLERGFLISQSLYFFEPLNNSNQKVVSHGHVSLLFYPQYLGVPISRINSRFPQRLKKSGFHRSFINFTYVFIFPHGNKQKHYF